jgi:hypothetical protein
MLGMAAHGVALAQEQYVAGLAPSVRPPAPVITEYVRDAAWYAAALHGVVSPYPASLHFLENQGAWFTPFVHPGMTGPYDIRGWHGAANSSANSN